MPPTNTLPPAPPSSPQPVKSLPSWVLIPIGLIFAIIFLVTGAWLFLPILIPLGLWYFRAYKKQQGDLKIFAAKYGLTYQAMVNLQDVDGVIFQTPTHIVGQTPGASSGYLVSWILQGKVANFAFRMYTYAFGNDTNSADSSGLVTVTSNKRANTNFIIMDINVPGEGLQFLLVSKTHKTALNSIDVSLKHLQLEGDFNQYFELYVPQGAEMEVLRIFTPDIMALLIDHYQQYGIELTPQHLFLYADSGGITKTVTNLEKMLGDATNLAAKFFTAIEKVDFSKEDIVAPELQVKTDRSRIAKRFTIGTTLVITAIILAFGGGVGALLMNDAKVPKGYVKASDAKVVKDQRIACQSSSDCSDSYDVRATFTAQDGRPYWHEDSLIASHEVGSSIELYYNPSDPSEAKFIGGHTSRGAIPIIIAFFGTFLIIIWATYFYSKRT